MKLRFKSVEDMEDANLLRRLLENDLPAEEAITIWKGAFPDIAIWSLEEMQEYLLQVFLFNPGEIDKLLQKYKNQIHKKVQPKRSMSPLPKFDKNDPNAIQMSKNYWEAMNHLKKAVNLLSVTTPVESNYDNNDEYERAITERKHINNLFLAIRKHIDRHLNNFHQSIQGAG